MRTALLLPLSAVVVAAVGLALPPPQLVGSGAARVDPTTVRATARASGPPGPAREVSGDPVAGTPSGVPRSPASLRGRWAWPLSPRPTVVRPFVRPATAYGAGHRGIDLAGSVGQEVLAVEAGTVTHVGRLAGRGTVSVLHPSGVRSTYEPVEAGVTVGDVVAQQSRLGRLEAVGSHCQPTCLHLGAVRLRVYLDPLVFLAGARPVRLLPLAQVPDG